MTLYICKSKNAKLLVCGVLYQRNFTKFKKYIKTESDDILQDQLEDYIIKTVSNLRCMTLKCIFGPVLLPYVILDDFDKKIFHLF